MNDITTTALAAIQGAQQYRENRIPAPLIVGGVETRLTKWLQKDSWAPRQGALLVCGFDPDTYREKSYGQDIKGAKGLCGGGFMGNHHFESVELVLRTWGERFQCPEKVAPAEFVAWCESKDIDTGWLAAEAQKTAALDDPAPSANAPAMALPEPVAPAPPMPSTSAPAVAGPESAGALPLTNWKMRVQAAAAARWLDLRGRGMNPTVASILGDMVRWCRENDVLTDSGITPSEGYLRTHVLGGKHWTHPTKQGRTS